MNLPRLISVALAFMFFALAPAGERSIQCPPTPVPISYFGLHIHHLDSPTPWPPIRFGSWRLWDAHATWLDLEPAKGRWNFTKLDKLVQEAAAHRVEVVLSLSMTPAWASARPKDPCPYALGCSSPPANMDDWRNYVRTVATRYKGRVRYYELWNEANTRESYSGDLTTLISLAREAYAIVHRVDPSNQVISPSATGGEKGVAWLREYLAAGGAKYCDIVGFHFYVSPRPEQIVDLIGQVKKAMRDSGAAAKPLWNTESGFLIQNRDNSVPEKLASTYGPIVGGNLAAGYVARSLILAWASGVQRFYWYAWDNNALGLTEPGGIELKPAAKAYGEVEKWLVGGIVTSCRYDDSNTWECDLTRGADYRGAIVWNPNGQRAYLPASEMRIERDLTGALNTVKSGNPVEVGPEPVLLENRPFRDVRVTP